ncbi:hypothetical protein [Pandoraea pulmonicola]|uniref:Uncharacterized protein n=1 Tax=Pandoraea pulmonicola TaxID=93221 RepID=A0AAJ4ZA74_PANPU|nr:hypothetical protein [Pandoraea pulmonicola]SUA89642.1 Uncharacterised protein [Pandoraea pulmonicola]
MAFSTKDADVFIRILIDDLIIASGTTNGVYIIPNATMNVSRGDKICWLVEMLNPKSSGYATINEIGNAGAWGTTGQPEMATDITDGTAYVGIAEAAGTFYYNTSLDIVSSTGETVTAKFAPAVVVA